MSFRPPRGVLSELVKGAREDLAARLRTRATPLKPVRRERHRFVRALEQRGDGLFPLICEVKRASPSQGPLNASADAPATAQTYVRAGARCVSVLTESRRFGGSLEDLRRARAAVDAPLLRKDFLVAPEMVLESAEAGADAVLLIAAAVERSVLVEMYDAACELGLDVLLELVSEDDLDALSLRPFELVGINARNLETLEVDPGRFARLAPQVASAGRLLVAESGIKTPDDIRRAKEAGAHAALVGEALMRSEHPAALVRALAEAVR